MSIKGKTYADGLQAGVDYYRHVADAMEKDDRDGIVTFPSLVMREVWREKIVCLRVYATALADVAANARREAAPKGLTVEEFRKLRRGDVVVWVADGDIGLVTEVEYISRLGGLGEHLSGECRIMVVWERIASRGGPSYQYSEADAKRLSLRTCAE